jgi:hypothetical protein
VSPWDWIGTVLLEFLNLLAVVWRIWEKRLFDEFCPKLVQTAAEVLEDLIHSPEES